jgi:sugar (pentulose or hexulose) kinase
MRDLFDALDFTGGRVLLTGGGAQNPLWAQMIADLAGRDVHVPEGTQFGARGAALLAATAAGHFPSIGEASAAVASGGTTYKADAAGGAALAPALARYREARDKLLGSPAKPVDSGAP